MVSVETANAASAPCLQETKEKLSSDLISENISSNFNVHQTKKSQLSEKRDLSCGTQSRRFSSNVFTEKKKLFISSQELSYLEKLEKFSCYQENFFLSTKFSKKKIGFVKAGRKSERINLFYDLSIDF